MQMLRILTFPNITHNTAGDRVGVDPSSFLYALFENRSSASSLYDETFLLEEDLQSSRCRISIEKSVLNSVGFGAHQTSRIHTLSTHNPF